MPSLSPPADAMYPASHRYGRMEPPQMPRPIAAWTITDAHARKGGGRRTRKDETKTKTQKKNKKQESMEAIASSFTGGQKVGQTIMEQRGRKSCERSLI